MRLVLGVGREPSVVDTFMGLDDGGVHRVTSLVLPTLIKLYHFI